MRRQSWIEAQNPQLGERASNQSSLLAWRDHRGDEEQRPGIIIATSAQKNGWSIVICRGF